MTDFDKIFEVVKETRDIVRNQPSRDDIELIAENAAFRAVSEHNRNCSVKSEVSAFVSQTATNALSPKPTDSQFIRILKQAGPPIAAAIVTALGFGVAT